MNVLLFKLSMGRIDHFPLCKNMCKNTCRRENVTNPDIEFIQGMLEQIKQNAEIGVRYMQSWEIKQRFRDEGYGEGYDEGYDEGRCRTLVESVENAIKNFRLDVKTACEGLGITVEVYEKAKLFLARVHEES